MNCGISVDNDKEAEELFNALMNYTYAQVSARMIAYGEPFDAALANYIKEIENEDTAKS